MWCLQSTIQGDLNQVRLWGLAIAYSTYSNINSTLYHFGSSSTTVVRGI